MRSTQLKRPARGQGREEEWPRGRIPVYVFTALAINYIDRVVLSVAVRDLGLSTIELGYLFSAFLFTSYSCRSGAATSVGARKAVAPLADSAKTELAHTRRRADRWRGKKRAFAVIGMLDESPHIALHQSLIGLRTLPGAGSILCEGAGG